MDSLRKFFSENENAKLYLVVIFVLGVLLFSSSSLFEKKEEVRSESLKNLSDNQLESEMYSNYENELSKELEEILSLVDGAGKVKCMITFENTKETIFAKDYVEDISSVIEKDSQNGERKTTNENKDEKLVFVGNDTPLIVKEVLPQVKGVVIVAEGGDNVFIKKDFIDVATSLLNVESHKVQILKMN